MPSAPRRTVLCSMRPTPPDHIYSGKRSNAVRFCNEQYISEMEETMAVVMYEFFEDDVFVGESLCVWDIDIPNGFTDRERVALYRREVPEKIKPLMSLLEETIKVPYRVYFSGHKGIHVYVQDPMLFVKFTNATPNYESYIASLYGPAIASQIDCGPFQHGHGIRIYSCPHPKTGIPPICIHNSHGFDMDEFWLALNEWKPNQTNTPPASPRHRHYNAENGAYVHGNGTTVVRMPAAAAPPDVDMLTALQGFLESKQPNATNGMLHKKNNVVVFPGCLWCPLANREHSSAYKGYWKIYTWHAVLQCWAGSCQGKQFILTLDRETCATAIPRGIQPKAVTLLDNSSPYITAERLEQTFTNGSRIVFMVCGMGAGKTTAVSQWCEEHLKDGMKAIALCTRRAQSCFYQGVYKNSDFVNYLDCPPGPLLVKEDRLIVCINSIARCFPVSVDEGALVQDVPALDLLVVDELEDMIQTLCGRLLDTRKTPMAEVWKYFRCLVLQAKRVVFMDGLPGPMTWKFLQEIGFLGMTHVISKPIKADYRTYIFYNSGYAFMRRYEETLLRAKNPGCAVAVVSNTKQQLLGMMTRVPPNLTQIFITGASSDDTKKTALDPNKYWKVDVLGYNPAVGPGASFDAVEHFGEIFCYLVVTTSSPINTLQLIHRLRSLAHARVHILIETYNRKAPMPTKESILQRHATKILEFHGLQNNFTNLTLRGPQRRLDLAVDDTGRIARALRGGGERLQLRLDSPKMYDLVIEAELERKRYADSTVYRDEMIRLIHSTGGFVIFNPNVAQQKRFSDILRARLQRDLQEHQLATPQIDPALDIRDDKLRTAFCQKVKYLHVDCQNLFRKIRHVNTPETVDAQTYEREYNDVQRGRFLPYMDCVSIWLPAMRRLFKHLGVTVDPTTGALHGSFQHTLFLQPEVKGEIHIVTELFRDKTGTDVDTYIEDDDKYTTLKAKVNRFFGMFGLCVMKYGEKRFVKEDGKRGRINVLQFDPQVVCFRQCMDKMNVQTGETFASVQEAFDFYSVINSGTCHQGSPLGVRQRSELED